ncbi:hypothetical protein, partial [Streptomyces sp. NPDC093544]|uniref:hypothetical protein n=1 Tax=Streptomyces sp. NPDC093544 TaxID=3155200 RepID=UPI003425EFAD
GNPRQAVAHHLGELECLPVAAGRVRQIVCPPALLRGAQGEGGVGLGLRLRGSCAAASAG